MNSVNSMMLRNAKDVKLNHNIFCTKTTWKRFKAMAAYYENMEIALLDLMNTHKKYHKIMVESDGNNVTDYVPSVGTGEIL